MIYGIRNYRVPLDLVMQLWLSTIQNVGTVMVKLVGDKRQGPSDDASFPSPYIVCV